MALHLCTPDPSLCRSGDFGQFGIGNRADSFVPKLAAGGRRFSALSAGTTFTCGLDKDSGQAWCMGEAPPEFHQGNVLPAPHKQLSLNSVTDAVLPSLHGSLTGTNVAPRPQCGHVFTGVRHRPVLRRMDSILEWQRHAECGSGCRDFCRPI